MVEIKKLQNNIFVIKALVVIFIVIMLVCAFFSWHEMRIVNMDTEDLPMIDYEVDHTLTFDKFIFEPNDNEINLEGWCVVEGASTGPIEIQVLLKEIDGENCYCLPTSLQKRPDVTQFFDDGNNYDYSGFKINMGLEKLDFNNISYKVLICYNVDEKNYLFDSGYVLDEKGTNNE